MKKGSISRRDFLKLSGLAIGGLAFPIHRPWDQPYPDLLGRVTIQEIDVYSQPRSDTSLIVGKRYRDQLVVIYKPLEAPDGPTYNPVWYQVWGGYVHSAYLQLVNVYFNPVLDRIREDGQLCEVSVPFTDSYRYSRYDGWRNQYRLYFETTHWVTGIAEGPDGEPWYEITNELDRYLTYFAPAAHLRPILNDEITPISPGFPREVALQ